ncbi:MAG: HAMP domain-containing histidine kinase [Deltaproteobacteria bacterium]|nr:HAMP domain-containing histidine kinase [Deltaproteobacteria bacterium]
MSLSRFERKILAAMLLVALAPLVGALVLGRQVLLDAYRTGVNEEVKGQLEDGVRAHRAYLVALRDDAEHVADAIGGSAALRDALESDDADVRSTLQDFLRRYENVGAIAVLDGDETLVDARDEERLDPERWRPLSQDRPVTLSGGRRLLVSITLTAPVDAFEGLQAAGEQADLIGRLEDQADFVSETYVRVYVGALAVLIVLALMIALFYSRRVTGRVTVLANATRRVGAGDLTVHVPTEGADEVEELTDAFNTMVRDMRASRTRIEYLQRIGAWQQFARRLAHEIKNPLTPIQLAAQEMSRSYDGSDEAYAKKLDDACSIIEEEVATLRRLVGTFSNFAKLPAADLTDSDVGEFFADIERSVPAILEDVFGEGDSPVRVIVEPVADELPVQVDAMMLKRGVDNLIRNAVQALRDGGGSEVRVRATREGDQALLEILDDGPGIPEGQRGRVFDPYYTTKGDGTGLGLAIVKKVVLEHGGEIDVDESPSGGARFVVRLPLRETA